MTRFLALALAACLVVPVHAQVRQSGNVTPTHAAAWTTSGTIQDAGTATNPFLTTFGVQGPICVISGPITGQYQQFCLQTSLANGAVFSTQNFGGASAQGLSFNINGTVSGIPLVPLPTIPGDFVCFSNTTGSLVDCGNTFNLGLPNGQIFVGNASNLAAAHALSGDATITNTGVITVATVGGLSPFNASNLSSGTVPAARGGAGAINGALKGNGTGVVSQAACSDISDSAASCATDATNANNITSGVLSAARMDKTGGLAFYFDKGGTAQTGMTTGAYQQVTWSTSKFNTTGALLTSNRWTAPSNGMVQFDVAVEWTSGAASSGTPTFDYKIIKNSPTTCDGADVFATIGGALTGAPGFAAAAGGGVDQATATDVYEICAFGTSTGGNILQIDGNPAHVHWSGHYIR